MIKGELKRLNRRELVDIIYQMKKNEEELLGEIESLKRELEDKRLRIDNAGSIADAAMLVTNVFSAAQETADIYLREIALMKEDTEKECARRIEDTEKKIGEILAEGEKKAHELKARYNKEAATHKKLQAEIKELEQIKKRKS